MIFTFISFCQATQTNASGVIPLQVEQCHLNNEGTDLSKQIIHKIWLHHEIGL